MDFKNKWLVGTLRSLAGLMLIVFGLNGFLHFMPMPEMAGQAGVLMGALFSTPYMLWMIKGLEIVVGVMYLLDRWTAFANLLLAPLSVNFVAFHAVYALSGIGGGLFIFLVNLYLGWVHWDKYKAIFRN
ncbi:MAG: DoxX protein [Candidatus Woesearchaeota archaeon]|nr:DoxX protein [Candidatus Woesearchaeota archaeon]